MAPFLNYKGQVWIHKVAIFELSSFIQTYDSMGWLQGAPLGILKVKVWPYSLAVRARCESIRWPS